LKEAFESNIKLEEAHGGEKVDQEELFELRECNRILNKEKSDLSDAL